MAESATAPDGKILSKSFVLLFGVRFLTRIVELMNGTVIPLYITDRGYSLTVAGLVSTLYLYSCMWPRPFIGPMLDRKGRWLCVFASTALLGVIFGAYAALLPMTVFVLLRVVQGAANCGQSTAINCMFTDIIPPARMTEGIGYYGIAGTLASSVGPTLVLFFIDGYSYTTCFTAMSALCAAAAFSMFAIKDNRKAASISTPSYEAMSKEQVAPPKKQKLTWRNFIAMEALLPSLIMGGYVFSNMAVPIYIAVLGRERAIESLALYFAVGPWAGVVARLTVGRLARRFDDIPVTIVSMAAVAATMLGIYASHTILPLVLCGISYNYFHTVVYTTVKSVTVRRAKPEERGTNMSTFMMIMDIGQGAGAMVWGIVGTAVGVGTIYPLCAICTLAVMLCVIFLLKPNMKPLISME